MSPAPSTAIRFHEYGEPLDVLREQRVEVADPPAGRVRVRVAAAGLNPADWELCRGFMAGSLPRGIGYDVAGTVDAVGENVEDVAVGDLVFGTADFTGQPSAGVADVAILNSWYRVPEGLDPVAAAVLPMAVQTAQWTLDAMGVDSGTTLMVNGAGAAVGFAAVQIALRRGATRHRLRRPHLHRRTDGVRRASHTVWRGDGRAGPRPGPAARSTSCWTPRRRTAGTIPELIAIVGEPHRVMTISNHEEARRLGARVNLDHVVRPHRARHFCRSTPHSRPTAHSASRSLAPTRSANGERPSSSACPAIPTARSSWFPKN